MSRKNAYTIRWRAIDCKGRDCGTKEVNGTMTHAAKALAGWFCSFPDNMEFTVSRYGDEASYKLRWFDCDNRTYTDMYNLEPNDTKTSALWGWSAEAQWRQAFAEALDEALWSYGIELTGYYF